MKVKAFGKINLTLDVTGRREDGFHLLDTVMQSVTVWDELEIQRSHEPGVHLQCSRESLPVDTKNTAFRAAKFFLEDQGLGDQGVYIFIRKHIPARSGMGGGSADAAAVLWGLNYMFSANLKVEKLMELGARVGSDVPFCVVGGAAPVLAGGVQAPHGYEHPPGLFVAGPVSSFQHPGHPENAGGPSGGQPAAHCPVCGKPI